jgi:hypothetical protein
MTRGASGAARGRSKGPVAQDVRGGRWHRGGWGGGWHRDDMGKKGCDP